MNEQFKEWTDRALKSAITSVISFSFKHGLLKPDNIQPDEKIAGLLRYDQTSETDMFLSSIKILVKTEKEKNQIIQALKYIDNNFNDIDTDYVAVNAIVHMYLDPDSIVVEKPVDISVDDGYNSSTK